MSAKLFTSFTLFFAIIVRLYDSLYLSNAYEENDHYLIDIKSNLSIEVLTQEETVDHSGFLSTEKNEGPVSNIKQSMNGGESRPSTHQLLEDDLIGWKEYPMDETPSDELDTTEITREASTVTSSQPETTADTTETTSTEEISTTTKGKATTSSGSLFGILILSLFMVMSQ